MLGRRHWQRRIAQLDPHEDYAEICRILSMYEFPWDMTQSLSLALFRTFAVPTIGGLLASTAEFTDRPQKRYDDTALILAGALEEGLASSDGRDALRRMNHMHGAYGIANDDLRYVLSTFVVVPYRWLTRFGYRRITTAERDAGVRYYRELGKRMGIRQIPETFDEFGSLLDAYERDRFGFDEGSHAVAVSTLDLLSSFYPWVPQRAVNLFSRSLIDAHVLAALGLAEPPGWVRRAVVALMITRGRVLRLFPARAKPVHIKNLRTVRSYPNGYSVADLGTWPEPPQRASQAR